MKRFLILFLLVLVFSVAGCIPSAPNPASNDTERITDEVVWMTNADRAGHGVPNVEWDGNLAQYAYDRCYQLMAQGYLSHDGFYADPGWFGYGRRGENIEKVVYGPGSDISHLSGVFIESLYMASPSHRDAILDPGYRDFGVWTCRQDEHGFTGVYNVVEFAG